jgi:uncharacterized protein YgiM (DUF1202 family)
MFTNSGKRVLFVPVIFAVISLFFYCDLIGAQTLDKLRDSIKNDAISSIKRPGVVIMPEYSDKDPQGLSVRSTPGGIVIGQLNYNDKVEILSRDGKWCKIIFREGAGYVNSAFIVDGAPAASGISRPGVVTDKDPAGLNVRSAPGRSGIVIGQLYYNDKVEILSQEGEWFKIIFMEGAGYVNSAFISGQAPPASGISRPGVVTDKDPAGLNVRSAPDGKIIGRLYYNDKVEILSREGKWCKIIFREGAGYVHGAFISGQAPPASR